MAGTECRGSLYHVGLDFEGVERHCTGCGTYSFSTLLGAPHKLCRLSKLFSSTSFSVPSWTSCTGFDAKPTFVSNLGSPSNVLEVKWRLQVYALMKCTRTISLSTPLNMWSFKIVQRRAKLRLENNLAHYTVLLYRSQTTFAKHTLLRCSCVAQACRGHLWKILCRACLWSQGPDLQSVWLEQQE